MHRMAPVHKTEKPTLAPLSLNSFWKYGLAAARSTVSKSSPNYCNL